MQSNSKAGPVDAGVQRTRLVYMAMVGPVVVSAVALVLMEPTGDADATTPMMLVAVAVTMLGVASVVPRMMARGAMANAEGDVLEACVGAFFTSRIVHGALAEGIAMLGFVSTLLTGQLIWFVGHVVMFAVAFLHGFPRRSTMLALLPDDERAKFAADSYV